MERDLRWGILGAGIIAGRLADAVQREPGHELVAVASKTPAKAGEFAGRFGLRADTYEDLVADDTIDVVYVATTHNFHAENALLALEHGRHVLVEKPLTVNAAQAQALATRARQRNRFAMEAMWARFLPVWQALRETVAEGALGEVRHVDATFGGIVPPHYEPRLKDPHLAGGVTLDMGVYPLSLIGFALGERPADVVSQWRPAATGVDEIACAVLRYPRGCLAIVSTSFNLRMPEQVTLHGTEGFLQFPGFLHGDTFTVHHHGGRGDGADVREVQREREENPFVYQIREVRRRIAAGDLQSATMPLDESIAILEVMDRMREAWGLRYPSE